MRATLEPGALWGKIPAPASKSYTHRALCVAYQTHRSYRVVNPLSSDDTLATARGLKNLGCRMRIGRGTWKVLPGPGPSQRNVAIDCAASGTTWRLLAALAALSPARTVLTGSHRLEERPIAPLLRALEQLGADARNESNREGRATTIRGPLKGGIASISGGISSQFLSALLIALPRAASPSTIHVVDGLVSAPYVQATLSVLREAGIRVKVRGSTYRIPGGQRFGGSRFVVPGDASSAAYWWAAAAITGGSVTVSGIERRWPQADLEILRVLERAGAQVQVRSNSISVHGPVARGFDADLTDAPDLYPLLGVVACAVPGGRSYLRGASHAAAKESDRRKGTASLVKALGGHPGWIHRGSTLQISGAYRLRPIRLAGLVDHRMVMSAAVGALAASGPSTLSDASCVAKSYPGFWKDLQRLGGRLEVEP